MSSIFSCHSCWVFIFLSTSNVLFGGQCFSSTKRSKPQARVAQKEQSVASIPSCKSFEDMENAMHSKSISAIQASCDKYLNKFDFVALKKKLEEQAAQKKLEALFPQNQARQQELFALIKKAADQKTTLELSKKGEGSFTPRKSLSRTMSTMMLMPHYQNDLKEMYKAIQSNQEALLLLQTTLLEK